MVAWQKQTNKFESISAYVLEVKSFQGSTLKQMKKGMYKWVPGTLRNM